MGFRPSEEEEKYFQAENHAKREAIRVKLDTAAHVAAGKRSLAASLNTTEHAVVDAITTLGFDADTGRVFDLLPLVHVAWADGRVSSKERATVMQVVERRGIATDSEAWHLMESLLEKRPSEKFMEETLGLLRDLASTRTGADATLVDLCVDVAQASGGIFGFGNTVSDEEKELIARVASLLGDEAEAEFRKRLAR